MLSDIYGPLPEKTKGLFTHVVQIPVLEKEEGSLQHIILMPEKIYDIHVSIIPNYDYVFKYRDSYVPTDLTLIQKCKQIPNHKICKRNQPNIKLIDSQTRESSILKRYSDVKCNRSPYLLHGETSIPLIKGYIIMLLGKLTLDISSKDSIGTIELNYPELLL